MELVSYGNIRKKLIFLYTKPAWKGLKRRVSDMGTSSGSPVGTLKSGVNFTNLRIQV
jgi:hypothetical protein